VSNSIQRGTRANISVRNSDPVRRKPFNWWPGVHRYFSAKINAIIVNGRTVTYPGFGWRIIMGSPLRDWNYEHFFKITIDYNNSIPYWTTCVFHCDEWRTKNVSRMNSAERWVELSFILRPTVSRPVSLGIEHPSSAYDQILITVWQLRDCRFGAPSLTRGRVCRLQLLLALASADFLGSEFLGTRDHILLSQILDFRFRRLLRLSGSRWRYSTPPEFEFESYVTTDGQPASLSWNKAHTRGLRPDFIIVWQLRVCWFGAPSLTRGRVCRL
jgi:hypothetical protein